MPAIRPEPRDTSFETPARADVGSEDYYRTLVYDTLYHSPVGTFGALGGPTGGVQRFSELYQEEHDSEQAKLSPEEANTQYGIDGELKFDEPTTDRAAMIMHQRKLDELRREYVLQSGLDDHWSRKITGFGTSMVASLVDPVNLASMFVPVVGESKLLSGIERASGFMGKGLISPKTLAKLVGTNPAAYRLAKGGIEGLVGTALTEPLNIIPSLQDQSHYEWTDTLKGLAMGAGMGAGIHALLGAVGDHIRDTRARLNNLDPQTHEAAVMSAVADLARDQHVNSPESIISVDHNLVENDVRERYLQKYTEEAYSDYLKSLNREYPELQNSIKAETSRLAGITWNSAEDFSKLESLKAKSVQLEKELGIKSLDTEGLMPDSQRQELYAKVDSLTSEYKALSKKIKTDSFSHINDFARQEEIKNELSTIGNTLLNESAKIDSKISEFSSRLSDIENNVKSGLYSKEKERIHSLLSESTLSERKIHELSLFGQREFPETVKKDVKTETQSRIESIAKEQTQPAPEKTVDTAVDSDKSLGVEKIQEAPEHLPESEQDSVQAELEAETSSLASEIGQMSPSEEVQMKSLSQKLETWADGVIKDAKKNLNMGVDPQLATAYVVKGAILFYKGVKDLANWSAAMIKEFGDKVKPHLEDLHPIIRKYLDLAESPTEVYRKAETLRDAEVERYVEKMKEIVPGFSAIDVDLGVQEKLHAWFEKHPDLTPKQIEEHDPLAQMIIRSSQQDKVKLDMTNLSKEKLLEYLKNDNDEFAYLIGQSGEYDFNKMKRMAYLNPESKQLQRFLDRTMKALEDIRDETNIPSLDELEKYDETHAIPDSQHEPEADVQKSAPKYTLSKLEQADVMGITKDKDTINLIKRAVDDGVGCILNKAL